MGFFSKLKSIGGKLIHGAKTAHRIGQKVSKHWGRVKAIGGKVQAVFHHAKKMYHDAKSVGGLEDALNFAKKYQKKAKRFSKHMVDKFKDAGVYLPRRRGKKLGSVQMPAD